MLEILLPIEGKNCKIFWRCDSTQTSNCRWEKQNFLANITLCSDSSQYAIFSQSLINAGFFTFGIGPDILMKVFEDYIIFLIWAAWVLKQEIIFRQNHVYFNKISFCFLLTLEAFSNNGELLSTIDKMI